jgi:Homeobox KN domain
MAEFYSFFSNKELDDDIDGSISVLNINATTDAEGDFTCIDLGANELNKLIEQHVDDVGSVEVKPNDDPMENTDYNFDDHEFDFDSPVSFSDNMDEDTLWSNSIDDSTFRVVDQKNHHDFDSISTVGPSAPVLITPDKSLGQYADDGDQSTSHQIFAFRENQGTDIYDAAETARCWNLTDYERRDSFSHSYLRLIKELSFKLDSPSFLQTKDQVSTYSSIRKNFELRFKQILRDSCSPHSYDYNNDKSKETRLALDALYEDTIVQMNQLVAISTGSQYDASFCATSLSNNISPHPVSRSSFSGQINTTSSKKEFVSYMTAWLRDNWTNPYNDDEGLEEMAAATGSSTEVISNWLINARTRKWRPALRKALALNRPASYLLEDSLNIFDRKPVRALGPVLDVQCPSNSNCHNNNMTIPLVSTSIDPVEVLPLYLHQQWRQHGVDPSNHYMEDEAPIQPTKRIKTHYHQM